MSALSKPPEPDSPPQPPASAGGGSLDRMQAEVKALQQQALATQQSIKKLQAQESTAVQHAISTDLSGLASMDSTVLGVGSALALAGIAAWWYLWHRPRTRWIDAPPARKAAPMNPKMPLTGRDTNHQGSRSGHEAAWSWDASTVSGDSTQPYESGQAPLTRQEPHREFDPEAAASEVTRVRKYLAHKREARAQRQDHDAELVQGLDLDLGEATAATAPGPVRMQTELNNETVPASTQTSTPGGAVSDLDLDLGLGPWQQPVAAAAPELAAAPLDEDIDFWLPLEGPQATTEAEPSPDLVVESAPEPYIEPDLELDTPNPKPMLHTESAFDLTPSIQDSGTKGYDFTTTLALAEESAALELWNEARDLASEVLESDNPKLVSEALSLLERLNQMELDAPEDSPPVTGFR